MQQDPPHSLERAVSRPARVPGRVLVTGGAGFIASHLLPRLLEAGSSVTVVDDLSTGRRRNIERLGRGAVRFLEGTVSSVVPSLDPHAFDAIYHLAAAVGVRLVVERPIHTIETNIAETSAVLEFASRASLPILVASTSEVYGKSLRTPFREDDDVTYGPTIFPRWGYAISKAIDEHLALAFHRERDLPVRIVRFFNTVGPRQVGSYGMVLPRFVRAALTGGPLEVHGDGRQSRCFCDVRDVADALPRLMAEPSAEGRIFNLGNDEPISILELATLVREALRSPSEIVLMSYEEAFGPNFDDLRHRQPDLGRIREAIGYRPTIPLEQTILDLAAAMVEDAEGSAEGIAIQAGPRAVLGAVGSSSEGVGP